MLLHLSFVQYLGELLGSATLGQAERMLFKAQIHAQDRLEAFSRGRIHSGEVTLYRLAENHPVPSRMYFKRDAELTSSGLKSAFSLSMSLSESQFDRLLPFAVSGNVVVLTVYFAEQPDRLGQPDAFDEYIAERADAVWHVDVADHLEVRTATASVIGTQLLSQVPPLDR